jgi:5-methylthioadenosine/S-adenosylhomocysteine deaminase
MLAVVSLTRSSMGFQFQSIASMAPFLIDEFRISYAQVGWLVGLFLLPGAVIALPGGFLARRFGDRRVVSVGLLLMAAGGLVTAASPTFGLASLGRVVSGTGGILLNVLLAKMVADWFAGREVATAMAVMLNAWPAGIAIGIASLGALAGGTGWRAAMAATSAVAAGALVLMLTLYRDPPAAPGGSPAAAGRVGLTGRDVALAGLSGSAWATLNAGLIAFVSFAPGLLIARGASVADAGILVSLTMWVSLLSVPAGGYLADRFGFREGAIAAGCVATGAFMCLVAAVPAAPWLWFLLAGSTLGLPPGPIMTLLPRVLEPERLAGGFGVYYTITFLGMAAAQPAAGWLLDLTGSPTVPIYFAGLLLAGSAVFLGGVRLLVRRRVGAAVKTIGLALAAMTAAGCAAPGWPTAAVSGRVLVRHAALLVTMDPALGVGPLGLLEDGDVLLAGDRILAVGRGLHVPDAQVVDAAGKIVLPGFVDTHNHLWQSLIRGCGANKELLAWLEACVYPLRDVMTEADGYAGVRLSALDLITTGVTTVADWSHAFNPAFVRGNLRALDDSGLRYVFVPWTTAATADDIRRLKAEWIDLRPRATLQLAAHPAPALREDLGAAARLARELAVPLNVHLLESPRQRDDAPLRLLAAAGALGPPLVANHAIHLTDAEIGTLGALGVRVTHNPLSNMRLASGIIPLPELHAAGVRIGLGLDGGTNDASDMFATMRAAVGLQRARALSPDVYPSVVDVLRMATIDGAAVLGLDDQVGSLSPGKRADLVVLDPGGVNFAPRTDWLAQIVLNGQPANVEAVIVDGRPLKASGRLIGVSTTAAVSAAEAAARRIERARGGSP